MGLVVSWWVFVEVFQQDYEHKLVIASLGAITFAYGAAVHLILFPQDFLHAKTITS